ncbi:MAG: homoserine dehydrogenase [Deltaproteobacteria bacterium]|nr:homoserine dehydrogenase [Deltaproteobacteria bacterium]
MAQRAVKVGLLGLGTVGGGVAQLLLEEQERLADYLGAPLVLARAADLDESLARGLGLPGGVYCRDAWEVVNDPGIDIVVELIGGLKPAGDLILAALDQGKQVATANKHLLAKQGEAIFQKAREKQGGIAFEASVGGGIPLIQALREGLAANQISRCLGILNGTCNFILTQMREAGEPFEEVLKQAQAAGYAEADPTFDVEGIDTAHKLAIVTSLVTGRPADLAAIPTEGITRVTPLDIQFAGELGFKVKLLAELTYTAGRAAMRVHPALVPLGHPLAAVEGAFNAVFVQGDWVGDVLLYGKGAGRKPTASAVVGDVLALARDILTGCPGRVPPLGRMQEARGALSLAPAAEHRCQYYFRFSAEDKPSVLAAISRVLGDLGISIEAVTQKGRQAVGPVPVVMLTHEAREDQVQQALATIDALPEIAAKTMFLRVAC